MKHIKLLFLSFFLFSCSTERDSSLPPAKSSEENSTASFKRAAPKDVPPIIIGNIKYAAGMNEIIAFELLNDTVLWKREIYKLVYNENLESDVQDVYIDSIAIQGNSMSIRNEKEEWYLLNIETREVEQKLK